VRHLLQQGVFPSFPLLSVQKQFLTFFFLYFSRVRRTAGPSPESSTEESKSPLTPVYLLLMKGSLTPWILSVLSRCFCGSELKNGGSLNTLNYRDAMKCKGTNLNCGAPDGLNLFCTSPSLCFHLLLFNPLMASAPSSLHSRSTDNTQVLWKNWYGGFNLYQNPIYQNNGFQPTGLCLKETGDGAARLFNGPSLKTDDMTS
jgi:hypothetical protein